MVIEEVDDFGDFVQDDDEVMELEYLTEPWSDYDINETDKVFYPISLGEELNQRYLIEHKLGTGGGSTVWMAYDRLDKKEVALKIMASGSWAYNEIRMHDVIRDNVEDSSHLVTALATFSLPGNNSTEEGYQHQVIVFQLMGPCFDRYTIKKIPRATRMSAARQLLRALENLHNAGIVHRDLNERNCMWGLSSIDHLTRSAKYEAVGRPQKESIPFVKLWKPGELVIPLEFPDSLRTDQVYLGDFGLAKRLNDPETERGYPPPQYCSPERLHGKGPSFACDMWSYMTIFSLLYLGLVPFTNWPQGGVISGMVACLGPFPEDWKGSYVWGEACDSYYDQSEPADPNFTLSARITKMHPDCDEEERQHVLSVMNKVFNYDPDQRPTATELLHDPSFKAIMAKYGVDQGGPLE